MSSKIIQAEFAIEAKSNALPKLSEEETNRAMIRGLFARDGKKVKAIDSLKEMQEQITSALEEVNQNETDICLMLGTIFRRQNTLSDIVMHLVKKLDEMPDLALKKCP